LETKAGPSQVKGTGGSKNWGGALDRGGDNIQLLGQVFFPLGGGGGGAEPKGPHAKREEGSGLNGARGTIFQCPWAGTVGPVGGGVGTVWQGPGWGEARVLGVFWAIKAGRPKKAGKKNQNTKTKNTLISGSPTVRGGGWWGVNKPAETGPGGGWMQDRRGIFMRGGGAGAKTPGAHGGRVRRIWGAKEGRTLERKYSPRPRGGLGQVVSQLVRQRARQFPGGPGGAGPTHVCWFLRGVGPKGGGGELPRKGLPQTSRPKKGPRAPGRRCFGGAPRGSGNVKRGKPFAGPRGGGGAGNLWWQGEKLQAGWGAPGGLGWGGCRGASGEFGGDPSSGGRGGGGVLRVGSGKTGRGSESWAGGAFGWKGGANFGCAKKWVQGINRPWGQKKKTVPV